MLARLREACGNDPFEMAGIVEMNMLDLFSGACGGWSLGMHRAGFTTMAACEAVKWRRILYAANNPGVRVYDDVRTLTASRLLAGFGYLPDVIVGSPPCQDISSANTGGKGVEGERSKLYFEAIRLVGECRPSWFAFENSANLRTRGADAVLDALEALGYTCWPFVVRASDVGANHERARSWLIGCDVEQVTDVAGNGREARRQRWGVGCDVGVQEDIGHPAQERCGQGRPGRCAGPVDRAEQPPCGDAPDANSGQLRVAELSEQPGKEATVAGNADQGDTPHPDQARQAHGCMVTGLRQAQIADDGCCAGRRADGPGGGQVAVCASDSGDTDGPRADWSLADLAGRIRVDAGLPTRLAGTRVAVGGKRGTSAASLCVEAYGDSVLPQITEAVGRSIMRVERAMEVVG